MKTQPIQPFQPSWMIVTKIDKPKQPKTGYLPRSRTHTKKINPANETAFILMTHDVRKTGLKSAGKQCESNAKFSHLAPDWQGQ